MKFTPEMIEEDNRRWHARNIAVEMRYCSNYMKDRKDMTNLDIRFYAYLFRKGAELLEAQEPIESRLHLCDSCAKVYPECDSVHDGVAFGSGVGNDNVIGCTAYVNRWEAQEPCADAEHDKYCRICGRAVNWDDSGC